MLTIYYHQFMPIWYQHSLFQDNLDGEEQSLQVPAANPFEDSNDRINRLVAMHKSLSEANKASLLSQVKKRKRSTSAVDASNTVHISETDQLQQLTSSPTLISPVQNRSKRVGSKKSLVWKHFDTGLRGQDPIATCKYCRQVYACNRSTHGTSTLWHHLRFLC
jgi:hypothetical protein